MFYRKENLSSRLLQAVSKMKYQKDVWKMPDGCSLAMFSTLLRASLLYPIPSSDNNSQTNKVLQFQKIKKIARVHLAMQNIEFV
jgi:hypothetical protein